MKYDDLFKKLLILDSISLSANIEVLIADEDTYEEVVETTGAGAQSLVNLLHAVCLELVELRVILTWAYNCSAWTFLFNQSTSAYSSAL